jgi:hypothetical protein
MTRDPRGWKKAGEHLTLLRMAAGRGTSIYSEEALWFLPEIFSATSANQIGNQKSKTVN